MVNSLLRSRLAGAFAAMAALTRTPSAATPAVPDAPSQRPASRRRTGFRGGFPPLTPDQLQRAAQTVRAGHVAYEVSGDGERRSINPDRRVRRRIEARLGIRSGRQWKKFAKAARRQAKAQAGAA